jgi:peptidyl-tRNA hydrolase, PTH2 family
MIKQVIVVRKDLNMRKGKMCSQVAHASMKVFFDRIYQYTDTKIMIGDLNSDIIDLWINGPFTKIVVGCDSLSDILHIENLCKLDNILYAKIEDNGSTEFDGKKTVTCIAVGPDDDKKIDNITGSLRLL